MVKRLFYLVEVHNEQHPLLNYIHIVWVGGAVKAVQRITPVCNQTDLAATLLGQLGLKHDEFSFSRDVLSDTYTQPFAVNTYTEGFSENGSATFVNYDLTSSRVMVEQGSNGTLLMERCQALLQSAL